MFIYHNFAFLLQFVFDSASVRVVPLPCRLQCFCASPRHTASFASHSFGNLIYSLDREPAVETGRALKGWFIRVCARLYIYTIEAIAAYQLREHLLLKEHASLSVLYQEKEGCSLRIPRTIIYVVAVTTTTHCCSRDDISSKSDDE